MDILRAPRVSLLARPQFLEPAHLPVAWNGPSSDGERIAEFAGRLCYMSQANPAGRTTEGYLQNILRQGHGSVFEHAQYVVLLEGISRSCTHELVRHRAGFGYCLTGDTEVSSEHRIRGKRNGVRKRSLASLWQMAQTPHGRSRLKLLRLRSLDEQTGTFTAAGIAAIAQSGTKPVFRVELADGKSITCSADHRFLTPDGWQPLRDIVGALEVTAAGTAHVGHLETPLLCNGELAYRDKAWLEEQYHGRECSQDHIAQLADVSPHTIRAWIRKFGLQKSLGTWTRGRQPWNKNRRYAAGWSHSIETRAVLATAKLGPANPMWKGGVTRQSVKLRRGVEALRTACFATDDYTCRLCRMRGGALTVHHVVPIWSRPDLALEPTNLATLCSDCHHAVNGRELEYVERLGGRADALRGARPRVGRGNLLVPRVVAIRAVTYAGEQMTYDIEMDGPNPNFVANGIITHNSQLSQRYVDESRAAYVMPPAIQGNTALEAAWTTQMEAAHAAYVAQVNGLMTQYAHVADPVHRRKMSREAARSVLPNATETKIVVSGNVRAWRTMLELRLGEGAELEIRRLSLAILEILKGEAPSLFGDFEVYDAPDGTPAGRVQHHKV